MAIFVSEECCSMRASQAAGESQELPPVGAFPDVPVAGAGSFATASAQEEALPPTVPTTSMAESVTRHALMPPAEQFQYLLCGVDSLYVGLYVDWEKCFSKVQAILEKYKQTAQGTDGIVLESTPGRMYVFLPGGKPPNYRYHLKFSEYSLFISITEHAKQSPNVYLEINAEALWKFGILYNLDLVYEDLKYFNGKVDRIVPSRLDLCADFKLESGLTLPFLQQHAVCRSRDLATFIKGDTLETCYFGSASSPIRLRIYDKGKEVFKGGTKLWFADLWNCDDFNNIWRVEFQLRREALKQFHIDTIDHLWDDLGGVWRYLTNEWFSLRLLDNDRTNRRPLHPWWEEVTACSDKLGTDQQVCREFRKGSDASAQWFIAHIAGCLPSFAARVNARTYQDAILKLGKKLILHWKGKDFEKEFLKRAIKLGTIMEQQGGNDEQ